MRNFTFYVLSLSLALFTTTIYDAQAQEEESRADYRIRNDHSFQAKDWTISLGSSFIGYSYGYGKVFGGVPMVISFEYGIHRYLGTGLYGSMHHRKPVLQDRPYKQSVYTAGLRINGHFYNVLDDLIKKTNLKSDILDLYFSVNIGMNHMVTNLPVNKKTVFTLGVGFGLRAYPFKTKKVGLMTEIGHTIATPWLLGVSFRL